VSPAARSASRRARRPGCGEASMPVGTAPSWL